MTSHKFYAALVGAVLKGRLKEPFRPNDVRQACPRFAHNTYGVFLPKHRRGNPGNNSELFEQVGEGLYKLLRPIKYGLGK